MILPVEGATAPESRPCQMSDILDILAAKGLRTLFFLSMKLNIHKA